VAGGVDEGEVVTSGERGVEVRRPVDHAGELEAQRHEGEHLAHLAGQSQPGHLLARQPGPEQAELGARVTQLEPVDVEHRVSGHALALEHQLDEHLLLAVRPSVDADPVARVLAAELDPEVVVAEPPELVEDPEALQRELDPGLRVEAEEELLPGGAHPERLGHVVLGELVGDGEVLLDSWAAIRAKCLPMGS